MDHALCMIGQRQGDCGDVRRAPDVRTRRVFFTRFLWKKVSFSPVDSKSTQFLLETNSVKSVTRKPSPTIYQPSESRLNPTQASENPVSFTNHVKTGFRPACVEPTNSQSQSPSAIESRLSH
jgi:hypothetical protein